MPTPKISLCITTYNRFEYLLESFREVLNDERVGEVVIVDDCSKPEIYERIKTYCAGYPKVKLFQNSRTADVYENKKIAISKASFEYCIIFDSDNIITQAYLDAVYSVEWKPKTILAPDFAEPVFDYRKFAGCTFNKVNVATYAFAPRFDCLLNTMNYFVHRDSYLSVWQQKRDIKGADSIYMNYLWLLAGNEIHVLPGLQYYHRVEHSNGETNSNFLKHAKDSTPVCKEIEGWISQMR